MNTPMDAHAGLSAVDYDPFAAPALARVVPSTEAQREIWLAAKLGEEASLAYNEAVALHLHGALDQVALLDALQVLVDRHDALRASFGPDGETFCVAGSVTLAVRQADLAALDACTRAAALEERRAQAVLEPFDLETGPLFRAELLCLDEAEHVLLLCAHHLVCDGWSWWVIVRELGALYGLRCGTGSANLPPAPAFADYALQRAERPDRQASAVDEAWWVAHYAHRSPALDLPGDRPRPPRRGFASGREDHVLDAGLVGALRHLGARHGASLFATLLGSFAGLLGRLSGQSEVVLGIPAAAQANEGLADLVGHGVSLLPLRCGADPALPFAQLLKAASGELLDALEHQRCTFGSLLRQLDMPRDPSRLPLVSVLFNIDQALDQENSAFPGLTLALESVPRRFENFELFVNAVQEHGGLRLECQYNAGLFDAATVRRWLRAYETLLRAAVTQPDDTLGALPLVDAAARDELAHLQPPAHRWGDAPATMHGAFERQAAAAPERLALRFGNETLSYRALDERANRIAHGLIALGMPPGALVGIALERGPDMLAALLGTLKAGAGYVPLDPGFPAERLAYMVDDAKLAALLTQQSLAPCFPLAGSVVIALDAPPADWDALPSTPPALTVDPASTAYVIYTSGSTGRPKGVAIPHRAAANFLASMAERPGLHADDRLLAVTTLSFDIAVLELLGPLGVGAQVLLATREQAMDGDALQALLAEHAITLMQATPASWRMLLQAGWQGGPAFRALCGGEVLAPDLAAALLDRCGAVWNLYGPTETTVWSTCAKLERDQTIHIGTPIANTTAWVLDEQRQLCPLGVPGELWIGGAGVAIGYLHRPELTAERFIPDPFSDEPGARLYRTGDRARWLANGTLEHLGRADFQIKLRGFRIEPGEIESIVREDAAVADAAAMVCELAANDQRLVLYVAATEAEATLLPRLRGVLEAQLPGYMRPQLLVRLEAFPQTPNGKLDRKALPLPAAAAADRDPAPRIEDDDPRRRYLGNVWRELIGVSSIAPQDNFFDVGGHSLLAVELAARVRRETGVRLNLLDIASSTLAALAGQLPEPAETGRDDHFGRRLRRLLGLR